MSGPVAGMFMSLAKSMSGTDDSYIFVSDDQRRRVLKAVVESYYADMHGRDVIFDTNRNWCALLPAITMLFPDARILCCVRSPAWILDSVERHVQRSTIKPPKMFNYDVSGNVYTRVELLMKTGFVGIALNGLRQAWYGEDANRLIAIRYDSLVARPCEVINDLYELLGIPPFKHDFDHVEYDEPEFDEILGLPGFHKVEPRVEVRNRRAILPPDLFSQHDRSFWDMPGQNPRGVTIL
jgi:sulfotransferase